MKRLFVAALMGLALTGCATVNEMAFDKESRTVDTSAKSVVLMTIDVSRSDESRYVPNPFVVKLEKPNAQSKEERQNFKLNSDVDTVVDDGRTVYLARMALEPGKYRLAEIMGNANAFPIASLFVVPLYLDLDVSPNSITYVGRVTAKLRPRQEGEFRAGPLVPLIDQAVAGMSTGTWDVTVDDRSEKDVALFKANYPVLGNASVNRELLPPFDRVAVQRLWDGQQDEKQPAKAQSVKAPAVVATSEK